MNIRSIRHVSLAISLLTAMGRLQTGPGGAAGPTTVISDVTVISPERLALLESRPTTRSRRCSSAVD
jgi:hypothetical protein